jgi:putative ABC transport system substrate-binding protein
LFKAFRNGLTELGYAEGRNIAMESRWAAGKYERLPSLAAELVRLKRTTIRNPAATGGRRRGDALAAERGLTT